MLRIILAAVLLSYFFNGFSQATRLPISISIKADSTYGNPSKISGLKKATINNNYLTTRTARQQPFGLTVTIQNLADTVIAIWLMSCSREDNFTISDSCFAIQQKLCWSNYPE